MRKPRNRKRCARPLACVLGLLVVGTAFGQTDLRWRLAPNEKLELVLSQTSSTEAVIAGRTYKSSLKVAAALDWQVAAVDEVGIATIEQTLTHLRVTTELPGAPAAHYDSASQEGLTGAAKAIADEFRPLLGRPARLRLLPSGEIEEALEVPQAGQRGAEQQNASFSAKDVRQLLGRLLPAMPPEPVSPGDAWADCREQATPEGRIRIDSKYVARGPQLQDGRPVEKIEATYEFSAAAGKEVTLEFADQNHRGVFYFDAPAGRLLRGEIRQSMKLKLRLDDSQVEQSAQSLMTVEVRSKLAKKSEK